MVVWTASAPSWGSQSPDLCVRGTMGAYKRTCAGAEAKEREGGWRGTMKEGDPFAATSWGLSFAPLRENMGDAKRLLDTAQANRPRAPRARQTPAPLLHPGSSKTPTLFHSTARADNPSHDTELMSPVA